MRPGFESRAAVLQTIAPGFRSIRDLHNVLFCLRHERKKHSESLCTEATIDGLILVGGNYPVAIGSMICLCRSVVNGLHKVVFCDSLALSCAVHTAKNY
jgi:hypothetical protein